MDPSSSPVLIILGLMLLNSVLTMAYVAITNTRPVHLQEAAEDGDASAKQLLILLNQESQLRLTYTLLSTFIQFAMAGIAAVVLLWPSTDLALVQPPSGNPWGAVVGVLALAFVALIVGNHVPEGIGTMYAEPLSRAFVAPWRVLLFLLSPITHLLLLISRSIAKLFGGDTFVNQVTEAEIMTLVNAGHSDGVIEDDEKTMIYSVLRMDETNARQLMVPRMDIEALPQDASIPDALVRFNETGFSRIPVYHESIDNIIGLLYAKDLLRLWRENPHEQRPVQAYVRPACFVPETLAADELLKTLKKQKIHMAIVVDEFGGTAGLVTIEDLLEEIVGDIVDEYDKNEEAEWVKLGEDEYLIDGAMNLTDIHQLLAIDFDVDDIDTLGGYIYDTLGRVPQLGEFIDQADWALTVEAIEGRRIRKVRLRLKRAEAQTHADLPPSTQVEDRP